MFLCRLEDLADGDSRGFDLDNRGSDAAFMVRRGARVWMYVNACPHEGAPLAWRRHAHLNAARDRIVCSAHGAQFEIETGLCTLGPCLGQSLQPVLHRITGDGEIHIDADDSR